MTMPLSDLYRQRLNAGRRTAQFFFSIDIREKTRESYIRYTVIKI